MLKKFIKKYEGVSNVGNTPGNSGECVGLIQVYIAELGLKHVSSREIFNGFFKPINIVVKKAKSHVTNAAKSAPEQLFINLIRFKSFIASFMNMVPTKFNPITRCSTYFAPISNHGFSSLPFFITIPFTSSSLDIPAINFTITSDFNIHNPITSGTKSFLRFSIDFIKNVERFTSSIFNFVFGFSLHYSIVYYNARIMTPC